MMLTKSVPVIPPEKPRISENEMGKAKKNKST